MSVAFVPDTLPTSARHISRLVNGPESCWTSRMARTTDVCPASVTSSARRSGEFSPGWHVWRANHWPVDLTTRWIALWRHRRCARERCHRCRPPTPRTIIWCRPRPARAPQVRSFRERVLSCLPTNRQIVVLWHHLDATEEEEEVTDWLNGCVLFSNFPPPQYVNNMRKTEANMAVGDRVIVSSGFGSRPGILKYLGETQFAPGTWCGIQLDDPTGKNDGMVDGIRWVIGV